MLLACLLVHLCVMPGPSSGQEMDPSRLYPITAPIRDAGTFHYTTQTWTTRPERSSSKTTVYNNTCTWHGGLAYFAMEHCEEIYDDGRIPSPSDPYAPMGATQDNLISSYQVCYCTFHLPGTTDFSFGFYDNLGGNCAGGVPPSPPAPPANGAVAYHTFPGTLPGCGSATIACWIVTIDLSGGSEFCLASDGDGDFDDDPSQDNFTWLFQHNMPSWQTGGLRTGPLQAAEPVLATFGSCTYDIPCGSDPSWGHPCGTGLGSHDGLWVNVDGSQVGGPPGVACPQGSSSGSNCYSFGGWPSSPWGSIWLELRSSSTCSGASFELYCTGKLNSHGCEPYLTATGVPDASAQNGFVVAANDVVRNKFGISFWGDTPQSLPFHNGTLCVFPRSGA